MEVPSAKLRKRDAVGNLRELADELGVPRIAKLQDLSEQAFFTFHGEVLAKAGAPKDIAKAPQRCSPPPYNAGYVM